MHCGNEPGPVRGVGDVAGDRDDPGARRELGGGRLEPVCPTGVEHERPAPIGQRARQRAAEALRCSGDEGDPGGVRVRVSFHVRLLSERWDLEQVYTVFIPPGQEPALLAPVERS